MTPTLVQSAMGEVTMTNSGGTQTGTLNFSSNVTAGNTVVILFTGVADQSPSLNSYNASLSTNEVLSTGMVTSAAYVLNGTYPYLYFYYTLEPLQASGANSVTFSIPNPHSTASPLVIIQEWSGIASDGLMQVGKVSNIPFSFENFAPTTSAADNSGTSTQIVTGGWVNNQDTTIVFGIQLANGNQTFTGVGDGAGFSTPVTVYSATSNATLGLAYQINTAPQYNNGVFNLSSASKWQGLLIAIDTFAAPQIIQGLKNTSAAATVVKAYGSSTNTNNTLYASVYSNAAISTISGWTEIADNPFNGTEHLTTFYRQGTGTALNVTAASTGATVMELHIYELTGVLHPTSLDSAGVTNSATNTESMITTLGLNSLYGIAMYSSASDVAGNTYPNSLALTDTIQGYGTSSNHIKTGTYISSEYYQVIAPPILAQLYTVFGSNELQLNTTAPSNTNMGTNIVVFQAATAPVTDGLSGFLPAAGGGD